jgi:hypothetical protein
MHLFPGQKMTSGPKSKSGKKLDLTCAQKEKKEKSI